MNGRAFNFQSLPTAEYELTASYPGSSSMFYKVLVPRLRGPIYAATEFPLIGEARMEGVALGAHVLLTLSTGTAISGVVPFPSADTRARGCMHVWKRGGSHFRDVSNWAFEDDGLALAGGLAPGDYFVRAETRHDVSPWYAVKARAGEASQVEFALAKGSFLRVTANQGGQPISRGHLIVNHILGSPEPVEDLKQGKANIEPLAPGKYRVEVRSLGAEKAMTQRVVTVAGEAALQVHLDLPLDMT